MNRYNYVNIPKQVFTFMNPHIFKYPIDIYDLNQLTIFLNRHYSCIRPNIYPYHSFFINYNNMENHINYLLFDKWIFCNTLNVSTKLSRSLEYEDIQYLIAFVSICNFQKHYPIEYYNVLYSISR